ncbi:RDD family protein [Mycolicibacterium phlei]
MTSGNYAPRPGQYGAPTGAPAGVLVRWFARFIDGIIVVVASGLLSFFTHNLSSIWVTGLFTGLLMFVYFFVLETTTGSTLGKKLLGLRVLGAGGAPKPTAAQSAIRNSWTLLPIIPFIGGLLGVIAMFVIAITISGSATKQGKHDQLAGGTQVVKG